MSAFKEYPDAAFLAFAGPLSSGKDTAASYLERCGLQHISTGDMLRAEATRRGMSHERSVLSDVGQALRAEYGSQGALVLKAIETWKANRAELRFMGGLLVTGLRVVGEAQEARDNGAGLIWLDAPRERRYEWASGRGRGTADEISYEAFCAHEDLEMNGTGDPTRPHLSAIRAMCAIELNNDGSKEDLYQSIAANTGLYPRPWLLG